MTIKSQLIIEGQGKGGEPPKAAAIQQEQAEVAAEMTRVAADLQGPARESEVDAEMTRVAADLQGTARESEVDAELRSVDAKLAGLNP